MKSNAANLSRSVTRQPLRGSTVIINLRGLDPDNLLEATKTLQRSEEQEEDSNKKSTPAEVVLASSFMCQTLKSVALQFQLVAQSGIHANGGVCPFAVGVLLPIQLRSSSSVGSKRQRGSNFNGDAEEEESNGDKHRKEAEANVDSCSSSYNVTWLYHYADRVDSFTAIDSRGASSSTASATSTGQMVTEVHWSRGACWEEVRRRVLSQLEQALLLLKSSTIPTIPTTIESSDWSSPISAATPIITTTTPLAVYVRALTSCVSLTSKYFVSVPKPIIVPRKTSVATLVVDEDDVDEEEEIGGGEEATHASNEPPPVHVLLLTPSLREEEEGGEGGVTTTAVDRSLSQVARIMLKLNMRLILSVPASSGATSCMPSSLQTRLSSLAVLSRGFWGPQHQQQSSSGSIGNIPTSSSIEQVLGACIAEQLRHDDHGSVAVNGGNNGVLSLTTRKRLVSMLLSGGPIKGGAQLGAILCAYPLHPPSSFHADECGTTYVNTRDMSLLTPEAVMEAITAAAKQKDQKGGLLSTTANSNNNHPSIKRESGGGGGGVTVRPQRTAPMAVGNGQRTFSNTKIENAALKPEGGASSY